MPSILWGVDNVVMSDNSWVVAGGLFAGVEGADESVETVPSSDVTGTGFDWAATDFLAACGSGHHIGLAPEVESIPETSDDKGCKW